MYFGSALKWNLMLYAPWDLTLNVSQNPKWMNAYKIADDTIDEQMGNKDT